ncbi:MAG: S-layer homology domain-containing protein [Microcoleaceae cyanobacterium]
MTHSSSPNTPNIPPPPEPPSNDPSRNRDEWIAVLVALLAMGGIFFWVFDDTDRPGGLLLGRRSSSTQLRKPPKLSSPLTDSFSFEDTLPSQPATGLSSSALESETIQLQPRSSRLARGAGLVVGGGSLFGGSRPADTAPEATTTETDQETEASVEAETPVTSPGTLEQGTTEQDSVTPTDETETPETEAESSVPAETDQSDSDTPIFGLGSKPDALGSKTDTEDTPTEATAEAEGEETTEETATAETPTEDSTATADTDETADDEATTDQPQRPGFGIPILGLGNKTETEDSPTEAAAPTEGEETSTETATAEGEETPTEETATAETPTEDSTATADTEETATAETPTEDSTATADTDEAETEQADGTASPSEGEQTATAKKPEKPSFIGIPLPRLGSNSSETETPAASAGEFSDVPDDFWAKDYIQYFAQQEIITGYEDGSFKPEESMSRAAVAAQIDDAFGFAEAEREKALSFEDVANSFWAEPAIDATTKTGFLAGYPGDVFRPEKPISRTEALVALVSGLDLKPSGDPEEILSIYQDADQIPSWAVEKVAAATEAGLVVSYPNTDTLNPNAPASRAEVSAMIYQGLVQAGKADAMSSEYIVNPKQ